MMEDSTVKPVVALFVCCAVGCMAAGSASGGTVDMHSYYGNGPYVEPPYWLVPDLTKASVNAPPSPLDLTRQAEKATAYPGVIDRRDPFLRGKPIGRPQAMRYPRTYWDHMKDNSNISTTRPGASTLYIMSGPSSPSLLNRYPSYRTFEESKSRKTMQQYMQDSTSYQPR